MHRGRGSQRQPWCETVMPSAATPPVTSAPVSVFRDTSAARATEARGTLVIRNIFDLGEQQRIIGLVVAVSTRPASRQNARSVTHHIDDET